MKSAERCRSSHTKLDCNRQLFVQMETETLAFTHHIHFLLLFALRIGLGFARIKIRIIVTVVIIVIILIRFLFFTVTFILKCFPSEEKHSPRYYPLPDVVADLEISCK